MRYRIFGKKRTALNEKATFFDEVLSAEINEDLLQKATSTITCLNDASAMEESDVVAIYDDKGQTLYIGVVSSVAENVITCNQMQNFFATNFYAMTDSSSEKTFWATYSALRMFNRYLTHVAQGYRTSRSRISSNTEYLDVIPVDANMAACNSQIIIWTGTFPATKDIPWRTTNEVLDMEQFIYDVYSTFGIITYFVFPMEAYTKTMNPDVKQTICYVFKPELGSYRTNASTGVIESYYIDPYEEFSFGNNSEFITNINVITEIEDANTLYIYNSAGTTFRSLYSVKTNGEYVNLPNPNSYIRARYMPTKAKFVNSDETIANIVNAELKDIQYNHKINFTMLFDNNFYKFSDFKLGQKINFYVGNKQYNSLLTGWKYSINGNEDISSVQFVCGKVRNNLTSKLNLGKIK